jgi:hypothetical protein
MAVRKSDSAGRNASEDLRQSRDVRVAAAGGAYSLLFVGGLQVISAAAPERNRGGILAALYLLSYMSMGALALVLGAIATARGLSLAVDLGAAAIILMNVATLVLAGKTPSTISPSTAPPSCT